MTYAYAGICYTDLLCVPTFKKVSAHTHIIYNQTNIHIYLHMAEAALYIHYDMLHT